MSNKAKNTAPQKAENELESNMGEIFSRSEQFIENNKKGIFIAVVAIVLVVVGILGTRHFYLIPKEKEAQIAIFRGENYFQNNEWDKALFGDSLQYIGFEKIIDQYGITQTATLAKAYAGICYYHKGDYEKAISFLKKFSAGDEVVDPAVTGLIGDCYVDMDKAKDGLDFFLKAAKKADDPMLSPVYLKKAGRVYESLNDYKKAVEVYTSIKDKYPSSVEAQDIDKFIDRAQTKI